VSSCNDISRTGRPASIKQRHIHGRLSARSVHVRQALHAHRTRRLFLGVGPTRRGRSGPVRHTALCQLRPIPGRHIQLARAVRESAARPVDIRVGQVQRRHLRPFPVHRLVPKTRAKTSFFLERSTVVGRSEFVVAHAKRRFCFFQTRWSMN